MRHLTLPLFVVGIVTLLLVVGMSASAFAADSPHGDYTPDPGLGKCGMCHRPHEAQTSQGLLFLTEDSTTTVVTQTLFCFKCHGDSGPAESNAKATFESGFPSGHNTEDLAADDAGADLTNSCACCHDPHSRVAGLPRTEINGQTVDREASPNSWCLACHTPDLDPDPNWSGLVGDAYYDLLYQLSSRDASGYPTTGTFRGVTAYNASAHAAIPASDTVTIQESPLRTASRGEGDCLWCHASHRGASEYDNLLGEFGPSSPDDLGADACFGCHDPAEGYGTGHFIRDIEGRDEPWLAEGSPLPCYECHNAHGSRNGNTTLIQDSLGAGIDLSTPAGQSAFCYTCHLSSDGLGWNSYKSPAGMDTTATIYARSDLTSMVAGISRDDMVQLPASIPQHASGTLEGCNCHGTPHAPNPAGVSAGGQLCYDCHGSLRPFMEWNGSTPAAYGHIVGKVGRPGDTAEYPDYTASGDTKDKVYCLSCHVDHDLFYFGADKTPNDKGANLRTSIDSTVSAATDYDALTGGICLGCHDAAVGGVTYTVDRADYAGSAHDYIVDDATIVGYDDASAFNPNCTKCHTDEDEDGLDGRQDGTFKIAPHFSKSESRLASALGAVLALDSASQQVASTEENLCFACHSGTGAGPDGYGVLPGGVNMRASSRAVANQFALNFTHGVDDPGWAGVHSATETGFDSTNKHIECEDCHNPHVAGKTLHVAGGVGSTTPGLANGNRINTDSPLLGVWGVAATFGGNWTEPSAYATKTAEYEHEVCFKCHSGFNDAYDSNTRVTGNNPVFSWGGSGVNAWTNVALEFDPNNRSYHPVVAAASTSAARLGRMKPPWTTSGQTMACSDCHGARSADPAAAGPHGSSVPRILKGYWPTNTTNSALNVSGNPEYAYYLGGNYVGLLCAECHNFDSTAVPAHGANAHRDTDEGKCYFCHIVVPHGGGLDGLIGDGGGTAAEGGSTMPSRYAYNNDKSNMKMWGYNQMITGSGARNACDASGCNNHKNTGVADW